MLITFPSDVTPIALSHPDAAAAQLSRVFAGYAGGRSYLPDLEAQARQVVDDAIKAAAFLLAMTAPMGADPAVLTGITVDGPPTWDVQAADELRWSLADRGGPDVRDAVTVQTDLGPVVVIERMPGVEQVRTARRTGARPYLQLQAFLPEADSPHLLLLTLSTISAKGWDMQRLRFVEMIMAAQR
jgi:hypothetical protein